MNDTSWSAFDKVEASTWTHPFTFVYGNYAWLNERPIHYCLTNVSVADLWNNIRLMHEIPGVERWGFEALFQRAVRPEWVTRIKTRYLGDKNRFKFFPPITIAMLPCERNVPQRTYGNGTSFEIASKPTGGLEIGLPGLKMHFPRLSEKQLPAFGEPGRINWDKSHFAALAIDGQHRISALRAFLPRESQGANQADVPAALLVFDPHLPSGRDLIQITREIFIDINKNAKTVDDSRLILLDDRSFVNSLTRRLILQAYSDGETASDLSDQPVDPEVPLKIPEGIPQELVDAAAGREAADATKLKDWQFTSAFIINRGLQFYFLENRFEKFEELMEAESFEASSDDEMESAVATRAQEYEDGTEQEADWEMLAFPPNVTEKLVERAIRLHRAFLLGLFTAFTPYSKHIEKFRKAANTEEGSALRSILLSEGSLPGTARFETGISKNLEIGDPDKFKKIKKMIAGLAKPNGWENQLVWYSVFQRGILYQPSLLRTAMEIANKNGFESREFFAASLVDALNVLYADGLFDRHVKIEGFEIWSGIALKINNNGEIGLDGSDGAARRTGLLIRLLICAVLVRESGEWGHLKACLGKHGIGGAVGEVQRGYARYAKAVDTLAASTKDDSDYVALAQRRLLSVLMSVAETKI